MTNTGSSVLNGDLGVNPGAAITGFPPGTVAGGTTDAGGATSLAAQNDVTTAYNALTAQACTTTYAVPTDIGGLTLNPGVYCFTSSGAITGTVTLNGGGNANAVFIFKFGSTLTTAGASVVSLISNAQPCNVFWQVGSSATLGTASTFVGNILALTSITLTTSANVQGRALARNGAVTLDTNTLTKTTCSTTGGGPGTPGTCPVISISPSSLPTGTVGVAYSQTIRAGNGLAADSTYTFTKTANSGPLPPGFTLTTAGVLSGTPTGTGTYDFAIRATDANSCYNEIIYAFSSIIAVPTLPQAFLILLALGLTAIGYMQLRRRTPVA